MSLQEEDRNPSKAEETHRMLADLDEIEVSIDRIVTGGDGFGRWNGLPVFVPFSAPGDHLRIGIVERRKGYVRGEIREVLKASNHRVTPRCRHFGLCGGCDLQHIEEKAQLRFKAAAARETLARLGGIRWAKSPRVVGGSPWAYRLRCQLHTETEISEVLEVQENLDIPEQPKLPEQPEQPEQLEQLEQPEQPETVSSTIGFHERASHRVVSLQECPILEGPLERFVLSLEERLVEAPPRRMDLALGDEQISVAPVVEDLPRGELRRKVGNFEYSFDARCFFQGHGPLVETLVREVVGTEKGAEVWDLYAGVGLFSLPLARRYRKVVAVEADAVAARYGKKNGRKNGVENLEVKCQRLESFVYRMPRNVDRVVVDPPRGGLSKKVVKVLMQKAPLAITYTSCHTATLARDLKLLGNLYEIHDAVFVDLFPQTGHLETVVHLRRKKKNGEWMSLDWSRETPRKPRGRAERPSRHNSRTNYYKAK